MPDDNNEDYDPYDFEPDPDDDDVSFEPSHPAKYSIGMKFFLTTETRLYGSYNNLQENFRGKVAEITGSPHPDDEPEDWAYKCNIYETDGSTLIKKGEDIYERELARPYDINWEERMKRHKK
jgi:hypothetical protein